MSAPARSRPTASSGIKPRTLAVDEEEVFTPRSLESAKPTEAVPAPFTHVDVAAETPPVTAIASTAPEAPAPPTPVAPAFDENAKLPMTLSVRGGLKKRAETAIMLTTMEEGGHKSLVSFVETAMQNELDRLAAKYNDGVPYEPNTGGFRTGRVLGS
jgi:cell division septation protein DedD